MSASNGKPYECLICASPIYNTNLGIDACRACTVFYRRHLANSKSLLCRKGTNDCYEKNTRPLCRKCRFVRFSTVLSQSTQTKSPDQYSSSPDAPSSDSSGHFSIEVPDDEGDLTPIDHRSFTLIASSTRDASTFERMKKSYSVLCLVRHCGEIGTEMLNPLKTDDDLREANGIKFHAISHSTKMANMKIMFEALLHFFDSCFEDFQSLTQETKEFILNRSAKLIHSLDCVYRAVHHFPDEDTLLPCYTHYMNEVVMEKFAKEIIPDINKDYAALQLKTNFVRNIQLNRSSFKRVAPTNEEFMALLGLSLWSNEISRVNEEYLELVSHNRTEIMTELHKMYTRQGRTDYSARLGDLLCLLNTLEQSAEQAEEDFQLIKLMLDRASGEFSKINCSGD